MIAPVTDADRSDILKEHGHAILHMRQQIAAKRFGLILGAGVSKPLGFPDWRTLIQRLAQSPAVAGKSLLRSARGNTSQAQLIYQHFRSSAMRAMRPRIRSDVHANAVVQADWQRLIHSALYKHVPRSIRTIMKRDKYLAAFLPVIKQTRVTINYNFDNTIQRMLAETRSVLERDTARGYMTVWNENIQMLPRDGDPQTMAARAVAKHKRVNAKGLARQQELMRRIYPESDGTSIIDTRGKTICQVTHEVARIVYQKEYAEAPLHKMLLRYVKNGNR